MAKELEK